MRFFRAVNASILRARLSLSAVSSSTELEAVLRSIPSFLRRSITSWLERFRSLASWKTLTFPIRLPSLARVFPHGLAHRGRFAFRGRGRFGLRSRLLLRRRLLLRLPPRLFLGRGLLGRQALRLLAGRLLGVAAVPFLLGDGGRLADLLRGLVPDALDRGQLLVGHAEEMVEAADADVDELLDRLVADALQAAQLLDDALHARHLRLDLLALLLLALDVDAPAHELGGQADVLALLADGEGELLVLDHDLHDLLLFVDDGDPADLGRRQRLLHEHDRVLVPLDDVDLLAAQ